MFLSKVTKFLFYLLLLLTAHLKSAHPVGFDMRGIFLPAA